MTTRKRDSNLKRNPILILCQRSIWCRHMFLLFNYVIDWLPCRMTNTIFLHYFFWSLTNPLLSFLWWLLTKTTSSANSRECIFALIFLDVILMMQAASCPIILDCYPIANIRDNTCRQYGQKYTCNREGCLQFYASEEDAESTRIWVVFMERETWSSNWWINLATQEDEEEKFKAGTYKRTSKKLYAK